MVVRVERVLEVAAPPEAVWEFIADPEKRARPISVVQDFDLREDGTAVWHIELPIPLLSRTIEIETSDRVRDAPQYVEFDGDSKVMRVIGEHELDGTDGGTRLTNRFVVEGKLPGVERFFKRNLEAELDNIEDALYDELGIAH